METVVHGHSERLLLMEGLMQVLVETQAQLTGTQAQHAETQAQLAGTLAQLAEAQGRLTQTQERLTETQERQTALLEELRRDTAQNQRIWIALCRHFGLDVTDILGQ